MRPSFRQIPRASAGFKDETGKPKRELHPFSLVLLIIWGAFIVGLLCLLQVAVTHGPESARDNDNFHPSWTLTTLPTILLTVFTQAHVPITAFHLARIAVSALQNSNATPNSWAELFWMADQEWTGPVGIIKTTFLSIRSRTRASFTYILFATTCAIALVTPVLLSQAYQVRQVLITQSRGIRLSAASVSDISAMYSLDDNYPLQGEIGVTSWETGLPMSDMYNASLFIPAGQPRNISPNYFFATDIGNATAILPGFQLQGKCAPLQDARPLDFIVQGDNLTTQLDLFDNYCYAQDMSTTARVSLEDFTTVFNTNFTLDLCESYIGDRNSKVAQSTGILFYNYTRLSPDPSSVKRVSETEYGFIQCNSTFSGGTASVSGVDRTYTNYTPVAQNFTERDGTPSNVLFSFLFYRFLWGFNTTTASATNRGNITKFRALGFQPYNIDSTDPLPNPPSPLNISESLWSGVEHFVAATANVYKKPNQVFNASVPRNVALYTRNTPYAISAYLMLTLWLALLVGVTAWSYRRTFSPSLNSYVAAELIYRERFLLEDVPIGEAGDNDRLKAPFVALGLCSEMELEQELKRRRTIRTI